MPGAAGGTTEPAAEGPAGAETEATVAAKATVDISTIETMAAAAFNSLKKVEENKIAQAAKERQPVEGEYQAQATNAKLFLYTLSIAALARTFFSNLQCVEEIEKIIEYDRERREDYERNETVYQMAAAPK
eukprot:SAG11_NODE_6526_length_1294_cov_3.996411_1_plen_130_part_10